MEKQTAQAGRAANDSQPLYQRVAGELIDGIRQGTYPVGTLLPTENELCDRFGVSRYTVREALRQLSKLGLVSRRQGSGTQVEAAEPGAVYSQSMRCLSELFQYAQETSLKLDSVERFVPDEDLAALLGGKAGRQWLRLQGVRRTPGGRPICRTTVYVHPDCLAVEPLVRDHKGPIYQLIEQTCGVRVMEVRQEIAAEPMPADIARSLGEKTGACALRITRRYVGENDMPVEVSVNHHPAEGFSYQMRLRRDEIGGA